MSVAARTADRVQHRRVPLARVRLGTVPLLAALVTGSFAVRLVVGWLRAGPTFFPDEYVYAELARSLAESGQPLIRGASASFPSLLQPLLTAPAWLAGDVETSFRIVQTLGALFISLAAVPVFLLARRLDLGRGVSFALGALAVALPDMVYAGWVVSEPVAYPLALAAFAVGISALARPRPRLQLAFLLLAGLAAFARAQFVVLPVCFLAATLLLGLRERRVRGALREQALVLAAVVLPALGLLALGPGRALGFYEGVLDLDLASAELAKWAGLDALLLVYASGAVLAPGALLGLWLAFHRPRSREELAFAALAVPFVLALLLEAAAYGLGSARLQERYFFYAVPLIGIAFALHASRGWPHRRALALLAAGLVAVSTRVPLSGFSAADRKTGSPTLIAQSRLEQVLGDVGLASLLVALLIGALLVVLVAASRRPRVATPLALGLTLVLCTVTYAGVVSDSVANAENTQRSLFGPDPSFVDSSGVEGTALVQTASSPHGVASAFLFWNRSVEKAYLLPGAERPDGFAVTRLSIGPDGTLLAGGEPVTRPLLTDTFSDTVQYRDSTTVAESHVYDLARTEGNQRLQLYAPGFYGDGWLALSGWVELWPEDAGEGLAGTLSFDLTAPDAVDRALVTFQAPGGQAKPVTVTPSRQEISFPVCSPGRWRLDFGAPSTGTLGGRYVSVRSTEPIFRPDPSVCR